jgi:GH15 family glucan-1,4-alpha-glucosidase
MPVRVWKFGLGLFLMGAVCEGQVSRAPWKGYAILGNGNLTAVYSDDSRITASTQAEGIQHLYFKDYGADYVASTRFRLVGEDGNALTPEGPAVVGMKNFFTTQTVTRFTNGVTHTVLCFVDADGAVVSSAGGRGSYQFTAGLRDTIKTDQTITLHSLRVLRDIALAEWSNGTVLAFAPKSVLDKIAATGASVVVSGSGSQAQVLIVPANSEGEAVAKVGRMRNRGDLETAAGKYWNTWMDSGKIPSLPAAYLEAYKRNLYCVKSANLNGQIPADITGQFVTNNMPQIYPRDAMMCARVLLLSGHADEARQVIDFWARPQVPMKSPGEWYARYDAHAKAVDAGSGARFDEPEWDANGYYIYLLNAYHRVKGVWPVDSRLVYLLADFLVAHISPNGLLHEGGIVEWTGDLPATNMIDAAALLTASRMAHEFGDQERSARYAGASRSISAALPQMFDPARQTYGDVRFTGVKGPNGESLPGAGQKLYLWDTTANVGVIWGYPNHRELELSNVFYKNNTVKLGGGMQYFDSPDPGLASYGHGVFFFTTAAAAEYETLRGQKSAAQGYIDWMMRNGNSYGLMPEHISPDGTEVSPASPLSWCSAEFAAALLLWSGS